MADPNRYRAIGGIATDRHYRGCIIYWRGRSIALPEHVIALYERVLGSGPAPLAADEPGLTELLSLELLVTTT